MAALASLRGLGLLTVLSRHRDHRVCRGKHHLLADRKFKALQLIKLLNLIGYLSDDLVCEMVCDHHLLQLVFI